MVNHGLGVDGRPKTQATGGNAANHTRLGGQGQQLKQLFFSGDGGHAFGHADAQVDHAVGPELQRSAPGDHLARVQWHSLHAVDRDADFTRISRVIGLQKGLHVVRRVAGDHHRIDQHTGYFDAARVQCAALGQAFDLGNHDAAAVARGHGNGQGFQRQRFALHAQVAVRVGGGGADDADVDREGFVEQIVFAVDVHAAHQVLGGSRIDLAATVQRVDKGVQTHVGQGAGFAGGDVAKQMGDHPLGQVVGFNLVADGQLLQLGHQPPVPTDDTCHQTRVAQVIQAAIFSITLSCGVDQRQVFG
ncbi:hypothetical protein GALL_468450 [mine drainage metagenome]|uniref:Uncharacterized protein n=1 Tax=mine drainage metagenome TaxID=410659 RepID=A0A1J5PUU3_9ZZZZ